MDPKREINKTKQFQYKITNQEILSMADIGIEDAIAQRN
jgi:hypothetical protein